MYNYTIAHYIYLYIYTCVYTTRTRQTINILMSTVLLVSVKYVSMYNVIFNGDTYSTCTHTSHSVHSEPDTLLQLHVYITTTHLELHVHSATTIIIASWIYMLMRNDEGRKKQARPYKQQSKATQHTQDCQCIYTHIYNNITPAFSTKRNSPGQLIKVFRASPLPECNQGKFKHPLGSQQLGQQLP